MKGLNTRLNALENTGGDGTGSEVTSIEEGVIGDTKSNRISSTQTSSLSRLEAGAKSSCLVTKKGKKSC